MCILVDGGLRRYQHSFIFSGICHSQTPCTYTRIFGAMFCVRNFNAIVKLAIHDLYVVSVIKPETGVVGHFSKWLSTPCNLLTRSGVLLHYHFLHRPRAFQEHSVHEQLYWQPVYIAEVGIKFSRLPPVFGKTVSIFWLF